MKLHSVCNIKNNVNALPRLCVYHFRSLYMYGSKHSHCYCTIQNYTGFKYSRVSQSDSISVDIVLLVRRASSAYITKLDRLSVVVSYCVKCIWFIYDWCRSYLLFMSFSLIHFSVFPTTADVCRSRVGLALHEARFSVLNSPDSLCSFLLLHSEQFMFTGRLYVCTGYARTTSRQFLQMQRKS